jgi:tetratricopeptide (TPR) repeat protein
VERLHTVLLGLRRQVALCLGWRRGRPKHWLEEYYFLLSWYGVSTGSYENLSYREHLGAFVSAGVASARYLFGRLSRLMSTAPNPGGDPVQEVLAGKYPDFREPLRLARKWARESGIKWKERALQVLRKLKTLYPDALQVRHELALVLRELGREDESQDELHDAGRDFKTLDEDLLSFWARSFKERGDKALAREMLEQALKLYVQAEKMYLRTYELRHDRFPGVNAATHRFLAASLAHQLGQLEQSRELVNSSRELARALLADKENWVQRLSDDNVWVRATEAEVYLLLGQWAEAEKLYQEARAQPNHQPFHSKSMGTQASRLVQAYRRLGQEPQGALSNVEQFFGARS